MPRTNAEIVRLFYETWSRGELPGPLEYMDADIEELREVGDSVVAVLSYRTKGRGSGVEIEGRESALWTLRDGKVTRYAWFHGADDAGAAART